MLQRIKPNFLIEIVYKNEKDKFRDNILQKLIVLYVCCTSKNFIESIVYFLYILHVTFYC